MYFVDVSQHSEINVSNNYDTLLQLPEIKIHNIQNIHDSIDSTTGKLIKVNYISTLQFLKYCWCLNDNFVNIECYTIYIVCIL